VILPAICVILATDRLLLRTFTIDCASLLYQLNSDPDLMTYTYDDIGNMDEAITALKQLTLLQYNLYHHNHWAVHVKDTMKFIGYCGFKYRPGRNETDLGHLFIKLHSGQQIFFVGA
jgi:RimJ/RimL family protein N-acetyltransferase